MISSRLMLGAYGSFVAQPALHLVSDGQGGQQVAPRSARILARRHAATAGSGKILGLSAVGQCQRHQRHCPERLASDPHRPALQLERACLIPHWLPIACGMSLLARHGITGPLEGPLHSVIEARRTTRLSLG